MESFRSSFGDHNEAWWFFSEAYRSQMAGQLQKARELYERSIELLPTAEAYTFLGWTFSFLHRVEEAIACCERAIEIDPEFGNPYNDIGAYLMAQGKLEESLPWLDLGQPREIDSDLPRKKLADVPPSGRSLAVAVYLDPADGRRAEDARAFHPVVVLTGGTIAEAVHRELARLSPGSGVDWSRIHLWWGDERFVPAGSPDRNAGQARAAFIDALDVPAERVHEVASTEQAADVDEAATAYAAELAEHAPDGFDVVMLGVGPGALPSDAHRNAEASPALREITSTFAATMKDE